jgi:hypothetical protein
LLSEPFLLYYTGDEPEYILMVIDYLSISLSAQKRLLHNLRVSCRHPFPTFDVRSLLSSG